MRRIICPLLCLLLFLSAFSACGKQREGIPTAEIPNDGTASQPSEEEQEKTAFSLSELPEIGEFVEDTKQSYFFDDGPHDEFTPRDDYGRLVCYYTDLKSERTPLWYDVPDEEQEYRYYNWADKCGLMTSDGRIVTSAVYDWADYEEYSPGKGCIALNYYDGEQYKTDIVSLDGSWSINAEHFYTLFDYGPYIIIQKDDTCIIYDLDGNQCFDLSEYMDSENTWNMPSVLALTEDYIAFKGIEDGEVENGAVVIDTEGEVVHTVTHDWYEKFGYEEWADGSYSEWGEFVGGIVFSLSVFDPGEPYDNHIRLYTIDGQMTDDVTYDYVGYDKHSGTIVTRRRQGSENIYILEYFNTYGEQLYPETQWNAENITLMDQNNEMYIPGKDCLLFENEDSTGYVDIFGKTLVFDIPEGEITDVLFIDGWDETVARVLTADKKAYICDLEGNLMFEIAYPYHYNEEYLGYDIECNGDQICFFDQNMVVHIYSISKRIELKSFPAPFSKDDYESYFTHHNYFVVSKNVNGETHYSLYYLPDMRLVARDQLSVEFQAGYVSASSRSHTIVLSPNGETLMRLRLDYSD